MKEAPLVGDDIALATCGGEVDSISFRLRYYDNPRLIDEKIDSEKYPNQLDQTSPSRYVWRNLYGDGVDEIKEYLKSLRYHADWVDRSESERVVMVTMHVGSDSTTSWAVYRLLEEEAYAGDDTIANYCPGDDPIDLTEYLSDDADLGGRFEPELSSGLGTFTPGVDTDSVYLYIVGEGWCADTATVQVLSSDRPVNSLDTVSLCAGVPTKIGYPSDLFSKVTWWTGDVGDSVLIMQEKNEVREVMVFWNDCNFTLPVVIDVQDISGMAGTDTTMTYCPGGDAVNMEEALSLQDGLTYSIIPSLKDGNLIFDPGEDLQGEYHVIVELDGCTDTAIVQMKESAEQSITLDPVTLCEGSEGEIGVEPGFFDAVKWWNGDIEDSTIVASDDAGPYEVEAFRNGCFYRGGFEVQVIRGITFPDIYPDWLVICEDEEEVVMVTGLDSVGWNDQMYFPGDLMVFDQEGSQFLSGYIKGCVATKSLEVDVIPNLAGEFDRIYEWCANRPVTLRLSNDTLGWTFEWEDTTGSNPRTVNDIGPYYFYITSDACIFKGSYSGVEKENCRECHISIPNAVSPNGDGINDDLQIFSTCSFNIISIEVFDKWGGRLYQTTTFKVDSQVWGDLPPGMVMVQVTYETEQGMVKTVAGGVMVIK